jgi:probable DNA repair protein
MVFSTNNITVCSTARLVRGVTLQYQAQQLERGLGQWQVQQVYTLQQWLEGLMSHASLLGIVASDALPALTLSTFAEAVLWEQAINSCIAKHEAAALFDIAALAKTAMEANQLLCDWQISEADFNDAYMSQETRQFLRWRHTFQALCHAKNAIEASRMVELQITLLQAHSAQISAVISWPEQLQLAGFDRITPLQQSLFSHLASCGVGISTLALQAATSAQISHFALGDSHAECRAAVAWAQAKLTQNPAVQLAIISPALGNIRRELLDLLDDTFHPDSLQPSNFERPRCYDFSLGLALADYPIVHSALQLLRLASSGAQLSFDEVTPLLHDVYWGDASELDARAQLDAYLRQQLHASYSLESLIKQTTKLQAEGLGVSVLVTHLAQIKQFQQLSQRRQLPSLWMAELTSLLATLRWANSRDPASNGLSSHEYQAQQALLKVQQELGALDNLLGKISANDAVQKIAELCRANMFQPEARGEIHIQILGLLETPAVQLDAVWALNMNDQHWPPAVKLNPLLPVDLQRNRGTPNASASIQTEFAQLVQQRLLQSAPQLVFSYALKEDERELRPSPLLALPAEAATPLPALVPSLSEILAQPTKMQLLDDHLAPAVLATDHIRGGVKLLATQAVCPAWAFYQYRLGAKALETPEDGLDTMTRGSLLHQVLQFFWEECKTQQQLQLMDALQRKLAIARAIERSIGALKHEVAASLPPQVLAIERERMLPLVDFFLDLEMQRADFSVHACEQKHSLEFEGLALNFTIDRIDTLADGGLVVIDYKTSSLVATKSWADDRIAEPQLPIYAALALQSEAVVAVCFAKIRSDDSKFIGLSAVADVLPDILALTAVRESSAFKRFTDWHALLQHWQLSLKTIAQEIKAGVAGVSFSQMEDLNYCEVKPLLRLAERRYQFERMQAKLFNTEMQSDSKQVAENDAGSHG